MGMGIRSRGRLRHISIDAFGIGDPAQGAAGDAGDAKVYSVAGAELLFAFFE